MSWLLQTNLHRCVGNLKIQLSSLTVVFEMLCSLVSFLDSSRTSLRTVLESLDFVHSTHDTESG